MASVVAGLAVLGALSACAGQPHQVGFGGHPEQLAPQPSIVAPAADAVLPDWPAPPLGTQALPAVQVDPTALPEGYPRLVWTEGDDRTLGVYGQEGGCTVVHPELREQTPELVRIVLVEVTESAGPCTMDLRFPRLMVALDAPLGDRLVVLERQTIGPPGY